MILAMSSRAKKWILALAIVGAAGLGVLILVGRHMAQRFEPYIKQQAIDYLRKRFESEVQLEALTVRIPKLSPTRLVFSKGAGVIAEVEGSGIVMRYRGRKDIPPMFAMKSFHFEVDLGKVFDPVKNIDLVRLDGMEIHIPPKGERPDFPDPEPGSKPPNVVIEHVEINNARLVILPKNRDRKPLDFALHEIHLKSAGPNRAMDYTARLTNPKPPGLIVSKGNFGPWNADSPSDTPLAGDYVFKNADLGVFKGIAGILQSTGKFQGVLSEISATGEARVPDFRLKRSGNPVSLQTTFEVGVDGTNGNTTLKPVHAVLGSTRFTTSGAVIKHEGDPRRTIKLDVDMPEGNMVDIMRLAMPGPPMMAGKLTLKTSLLVPPLSGKVIEKLELAGRFDIRDGQFLKSKIQDKLDSFSRRGQGQPKNETIDDVPSSMRGQFKLDDQTITFSELQFVVPGAAVDLAGNYQIDKDNLDFHGTLKLVAKVSQTMTGWKRFVLKPIDPFFSKNGAGTFIRIQVTGSSKDPNFGRDKGSKDNETDN